jgi:hypothetical protein
MQAESADTHTKSHTIPVGNRGYVVAEPSATRLDLLPGWHECYFVLDPIQLRALG